MSGCSGPRTFCRISQRFLKERFGFGVLAHRLIQLGQVIEALRRVGMFPAKDLLADLRSASCRSGSALA